MVFWDFAVRFNLGIPFFGGDLSTPDQANEPYDSTDLKSHVDISPLGTATGGKMSTRLFRSVESQGSAGLEGQMLRSSLCFSLRISPVSNRILLVAMLLSNPHFDN